MRNHRNVIYTPSVILKHANIILMFNPLKDKRCQLVTFCHPGLLYIFKFLTLAFSPKCQSARMSEIKNLGYTWTALNTFKCNCPTALHFKGLIATRDRLCQNYVKTTMNLHLHKHSTHTHFCHRRKICTLPDFCTNTDY